MAPFHQSLCVRATAPVSGDAVNWQPVTAEVERYPSSEENYDYLVPVRYRLEPGDGARYVRADFKGTSEIVRVELDYR